jgi:hypothetical protein
MDGAGPARLALDLALFVAVRRGDCELAMAYLESLDALRLVLRACGERTPVPHHDLEAFVSLAVGDRPLPADRLFCARLLRRQLDGARDLREARRRDSRVFTREDLDMLGAGIAELFQAAGSGAPDRGAFEVRS